MCQKKQELKVKTKFYRENSFDAANFKYIWKSVGLIVQPASSTENSLAIYSSGSYNLLPALNQLRTVQQ